MPEVRTSLGHAAKARVSELKRVRKKLTGMGLDPHEIDDELELLKGTKEKKGVFYALDVQEEQQESPPKDPAQRDIEDGADYRTWDLNTDGVRELVASEISGHPPVAAIQILNALEDGENEREPNPRKSVLDVIRDARKPLVAKVDKGNGTFAGPKAV